MGANAELSNAFKRIADLLEITGADRFRINSYRRAARTMKDLAEDVIRVADRDQLEALPGIGKATAAKIKQYLTDQRIDELDHLEGAVPEGLPDLLEIPGMGPKKVAAVWKQLGVENLGDLKQVIESGRLAQLSGFGKQSAQKITDGIRFREQTGGRVAYGEALPLAEALAEHLQGFAGVGDVHIAGSLRRGRETIGDIDLLCSAQDGQEVVDAFVNLEGAGEVLAAGDTKGSVILSLSPGASVQVDLRVVPQESIGAALQYFSGSKEHNVRLRELAIKKGLKLNEWGLFRGEEQVAGRDEEAIYRSLGLAFIPPELREDRGEFELSAEQLDTLVAPGDIKGDLHMHTPASDGRSTLEEMAEAAKALGYKYINIADHSKSSAIANGLSIKRMEAQLEQVRSFDEQFKGLRILVGCECDILSNGDLDYPDDLLAACDMVVASIHVAQGQERKTITRRALRAIANPHVHILGHPTSRLINRRAPSDIDIEEIIKAAVDTGTALEVNAAWKRLDLKDTHVRLAIDSGATLSINTDAHDTSGLRQMRYGVATARRGWAPKDQVINTYGLKKLLTWKSNLPKSVS